MGANVRLVFPRSKRTAHNNEPSVWTEITHPYHPFRGKRLRVLKTKKISGEETVILEGTERGTISVLREWTDLSDPSNEINSGLEQPALSVRKLIELAELVELLEKRLEKI